MAVVRQSLIRQHRRIHGVELTDLSIIKLLLVHREHGNDCMLLLQSLRVFKLAASLGGVDSLVEHPASMSHGPFCMSDDDRQEAHIDPALIRLR